MNPLSPSVSESHQPQKRHCVPARTLAAPIIAALAALLYLAALPLPAHAQLYNWILREGLSGIEYGWGIAADTDGNSYVTGAVRNSGTFRGTNGSFVTIPTRGNEDIFLLKFDPEGIILWAKNAGGKNGQGTGYAVAIDSSGNSVITGFFAGTVTFGQSPNTTVLTGTANISQFFVAKYDSDGNLLWAQKAGGNEYAAGRGIAADSSGNVFVSGEFVGTATFGEGGSSVNLTSAGESDIFFAKYNSAGILLWAHSGGGSLGDGGMGLSVSVDSAGNSYYTGDIRGAAIFGVSPNQVVLDSPAGGSLFVVKYDSAGTLEWAKTTSGTSYVSGRGLEVSDDNIYVTGRHQVGATFGDPPTTVTLKANGSFIAKFDSNGGLAWVKETSENASSNDIAVDGRGNSYFTGFLQQSAVFGQTPTTVVTLTSTSQANLFVAQYDPFGNLVWAKRDGGNATVYPRSIAVDTNGLVFMTGEYVGTALFDSTTLTNSGSTDIFITKLTPPVICFPLTSSHTGSGGDPQVTPEKSTGCSKGQYVAGESLSLTAAVDSGAQLESWNGTSDDSSTATSNSATMPASPYTVSVSYSQSPVPCYTLTLSHSGNGGDPQVIPEYSTGCSKGQYVAGAALAFTAAPDSDWFVASWSGTTNNSSTATSNSATMPAGNHAISVTYSQTPPTCFLLTRSHSGEGEDPTVTPPNSPGCSGGQFVAGESLILSAEPTPGWQIVGWEGLDHVYSGIAEVATSMPAAALNVLAVYGPVPDGDQLQYEPNEECSQANLIGTDGAAQEQRFHQQADTDWVRFDGVNGAEYLIEVQIPDTSPADVTVEIYNDCQTSSGKAQDISFSPGIRLGFKADASGPYFLKVWNVDAQVAGDQVRYLLSVRAKDRVSSPGLLIIAAGSIRSQDPVQPNIYSVTDAVYKLFLENGYTDERIYYLAPERSHSDKVDATSTRDNLKNAITQWAKENLGPERALTLYLMDHGDRRLFYLDKVRNESITPDDLDDWLDELEAALPGIKVNVIIEACYSGSFLVNPNSVSSTSLSAPGRVIITSTDANNLAWASKESATFSEHFLNALRLKQSLYQSFDEARIATRIAHPNQTAQLDADGDPQNVGPQDVAAASQRGFTFAGTLDDAPWPPYIASISLKPKEDGTVIISADVRDDSKVISVIALIYPPSYRAPTEGDSLVIEDPSMIQPVTLPDQLKDNQFAATFSGFVERGSYRIVFIATDNAGLKARPVVTFFANGQLLFMPTIRTP